MRTIPETLSIAIRLHQGGQLQAAEQIYRQILDVAPNQADAWHLLGAIHAQTGKHQLAVEHLSRALALKPDWAEAQANLGNAWQNQGKLEEAAACYRRALELKPEYVKAHVNLGVVLQDQGKPEEAVVSFRRALELKPDFAEAQNNLGNALRGQGNLGEAVARCRRAVETKPDYAEAHNNLGAALKDQGELEEAAACYRRTLELKPDFAEAHNNLGNALKDQGELEEAAACYRRALELKPDFAAPLGSLLHTLQHLCCWEDLQALSQRVIEVVDRGAGGGTAAAISPFIFLGLPAVTSAEHQLRCARQWAEHKWKALGGPRGDLLHDPLRDRQAAPKSKITVGYLSADFHGHATAWLIAELIEKHDRGRFAVLGYSYGPDDGSPTRRRLVEAFDRCVDLRDVSFADAAGRIAADRVDILVDLKGYTQHARTEILALRPAPIQVNYLGYPGTMGAEFMDYILVDDYVAPLDQQSFYTENLVHLPGCYQVNDSQREISPLGPSREECRLPPDGFVFCSFNNSYKITPEIFDVWMRLLNGVPGSVLWLLEGNRFAPANLRKEAKARGVAAERLFVAPRQPLPEHLARHRLADLFLDTFPVNAHTTASDALWAGLPLLTLAGQTFASRVAGSLLRAVGLPELIATSLEDYEAMALRLARDRRQLAELRERLEANRETSGLFDGGQFARKLEKAYRTMWEIYARGEKPRGFAILAH